MGTTVRTKVQKKQQAFVHSLEDATQSRRLEKSVMDLEDAVFHVLNADKGSNFHDVDFLFWSRKLKNTAAQISMALNEYRGPRKSHYHFRHDPKNHDSLYPVPGPTALDTLARVCREALTQCIEMVGIQDSQVLFARSRLEHALRSFLASNHGHH
jgi:hypothetical protein